MALIRLRGSELCEAGNVCPTLIKNTTTGAIGVQANTDDAATAALNVPPGEGVVWIPAELVPQLLYGLGPDTTTDTPGREVLA